MTSYRDIDWAICFHELSHAADKDEAGSEKSRRAWNEKAPSFARKMKRSGYIGKLIDLMALDPSETVLDFGCGSGTLAIPLARAGHAVLACDFSPVMLEELERAAGIADVAVARQTALPAPSAIAVCERSWQQCWDDLPRADAVISSRSLITDDLPDAIRKMEAHATQRVVLTTGVGDLPYRDARILAAMGRDTDDALDPAQLACIVNYLFSIGRLPRLDYIEVPGPWHRSTREELEQAIRRSHTPQSLEEKRALAAYLDAHIAFNDAEQRFELDYPRTNRWSYLTWEPPAHV